MLFLNVSLICLMAFGSTQAQPPAQFTLYVSAPTRDGFLDTSKEIQDSIKDVSSRLKNLKGFQIVDRAEDADIVITIVARGHGFQAFGQRIEDKQYYNGTTLTTTPVGVNTFWVTSVLKVGAYQKEFTGTYTQKSSSSMGAWTLCAKTLADNFRSWALANAEQLTKLRNKSSEIRDTIPNIKPFILAHLE